MAGNRRIVEAARSPGRGQCSLDLGSGVDGCPTPGQYGIETGVDYPFLRFLTMNRSVTDPLMVGTNDRLCMKASILQCF
jgi:hypothetical protein